jgi:hypothetical protein
VRLYHRTPASGLVLAGGFRDPEAGRLIGGLMLTGVWLSDQPLDGNEGTKGDALLEVIFPAGTALDDYEVAEDGKPYREWCVPAAMVNELAAVRLLPDPGAV